MKRILIKWFAVPLLLWTSVGCKYYQYRPDLNLERWDYREFDNKHWGKVEKEFHFVIHFNEETFEIKDVSYNEMTGDFSGTTVPFTGLPQVLYEKALPIPGKNIRRGWFDKSGPATNQIHFYLDRYSRSETSIVSFNMYQDIFKTEFVKQSPWNIAVGIEIALVFTTAFVIYVLMAIGY